MIYNTHFDNLRRYLYYRSGDQNLSQDIAQNVFMKIWNKKIDAWKSYKNEIRPFPFPRSIKSLKIIAQYRGLQSGLELAEAFRLERSILSND